MIWVLVVVLLCGMVILAQLTLSYQRRAHQLRSRQEPLQRRIRSHSKAMQEAVEKAVEAATSRIDEMIGKIEEHTAIADEYKPLLGELESEGHDSGLLEEEEPVTEEGLIDEEKDPSMLVSTDRVEEEEDDDEAVDVNALVADARSYQEEMDRHLGDLERDLNIVTRTLTRLQERAGANKKRKGSRDDNDLPTGAAQ